MLQIKSDAHIYFIGIGGVGMSSLALILHKKGYTVSGSDSAISETVNNLKSIGINIHIGQEKPHITDSVDYVVYSNAVSPDNPEYVYAQQKNLPLIVRAEMLNFIGAHYFSIGVSGTHGKTTTTSITARIFLSAGLDPTLAVGGHLPEIAGSGHLGQGNMMVYEACEAFGSLNYLYPDVALLTNIDEDHLEFFKNRQEVEDLFLNYFNTHLTPNSLLIWNADDDCLSEVVAKSSVIRKISTSIKSHGGDFWIENITLHSNSSEFDVFFEEECIGHFILGIPGIHNVSNALLAIAAAKLHGIDNISITQALTNFQNANRRFQIKNSNATMTVIDDYAHHPRAVSLTLEAARKLAEEKKAQLIAVFQPHLYSRTRYFYKEFSHSLQLADHVVLTDIYAARETNDDNTSSHLIYDEMIKTKSNTLITLEGDFNKILSLVQQIVSDQPAVIITLGAGDVWKISETLCENM